jgi:hypothetical protein
VRDLVGKGDDRHVAQPAEELAGLLLDAPGGVEHHHRTVDRAQRAVGVLAEILVARGVEQVNAAGPDCRIASVTPSVFWREKSGSQRTRRWREMDSNHRFLSRGSWFMLRKVNWGSTGQPKNFAGDRWFESISLQRC